MGRKRKKFPVGITERNGRIQIAFTHQDQECRVSLGIDSCQDNIRYAQRKRSEVLLDITKGGFSWKKHFPKSKQAKKESNEQQDLHLSTIEEYLNDFYERHEAPRLSASTNNANRKILTQLITEFGDIPVLELKPSRVAGFVQKRVQKNNLKTIRNILTPLSNMYKEIETDHCHRNPVKQVDIGIYYSRKHRDAIVVKNNSGRQAVNPYTGEQVSKIIIAADGQIRNLIQFLFYTGVRTGEVVALRWTDICFATNTVRVERSISSGEESSTKTGTSRVIFLLPSALEALKNQVKYTSSLKQFVFHDPKKGERWKNDQAIRNKAWHPTIKAANVEYRNPYQTRHTYATQLLMGGEDERFVANQLGHSSLEMIRRNYGNVLPDKNNPQNYKLRNEWSSFKDEQK